MTVGLIALLDVLHDVLDRLLDGTLTDTLPTDEDIHERGLVLYVIPISELHAVQVGSQCREHRIGHSGLVEPGHVLRQQPNQRRQLFGHRWRCCQRTTTSLHRLLRLQRLQHLLQPVRHSLLRLFQRTLDSSAPLVGVVLRTGAISLCPVVGHHRQHLLQLIAADAADSHSQLERQHVTVAVRGHLSVVEQFPILRDDVLEQHTVVSCLWVK